MRINKKVLKILPAIVYFGVIWYMSSKQVAIDITRFDKLFHVIEYAVMGFLLSFGFELKNDNFIKTGKYCLLIAVIAGATDEIHQYFIPWRCGSWADLIADTVGCLIGMGLWLVLFNIVKHSEVNNEQKRQ